MVIHFSDCLYLGLCGLLLARLGCFYFLHGLSFLRLVLNSCRRALDGFVDGGIGKLSAGGGFFSKPTKSVLTLSPFVTEALRLERFLILLLDLSASSLDLDLGTSDSDPDVGPLGERGVCGGPTFLDTSGSFSLPPIAG